MRVAVGAGLTKGRKVMDLYCSTCGEPWDNDSLHEEVDIRFRNDPRMVAYEAGRPGYRDQKLYEPMYREVAADFRAHGCKALENAFGEQGHCEPRNDDRSLVAAAMYDLLGDDMDGAAAMMDDFGL